MGFFWVYGNGVSDGAQHDWQRPARTMTLTADTFVRNWGVLATGNRKREDQTRLARALRLDGLNRSETVDGGDDRRSSSEHCNKHDTTTLALQTELIGTGIFLLFLSFYLYWRAKMSVSNSYLRRRKSIKNSKKKGKSFIQKQNQSFHVHLFLHIKF